MSLRDLLQGGGGLWWDPRLILSRDVVGLLVFLLGRNNGRLEREWRRIARIV